MLEFNIKPERTTVFESKEIHEFNFSQKTKNIDHKVVESFGEEWNKFLDFDEDEILKIGNEYFDILNPVLNKNSTQLADLGCGTGRWSKYLANRVKNIDAIDPSKAIYSAAHVLKNIENVRLIKSSIDFIPFKDESFDVVISVGVLHHIPNTTKALRACVKKLKIGGHFFVYLYYNLEGEPLMNRLIFKVVSFLRKIISSLPSNLKKFVCDIIALITYWPLAKSSLLLSKIGLESISNLIPLNYYKNKSFYIMRNDSLDRFGTALEQRFSKEEIIDIMKEAGLEEIQISTNKPKYCAIGKRVF